MSRPVDNFISRPQAARYLGFSLSTLDRLLRDGSIPYIRLRGRIYFTKERLDKWLQELETIPKEKEERELKLLMMQVSELDRDVRSLERDKRIEQLAETIFSPDFQKLDDLDKWELEDELKALVAERDEEKRRYLGLPQTEEEEEEKDKKLPVLHLTVNPNDPESIEAARVAEQQARKTRQRLNITYESNYSDKGRKKLDEEWQKKVKEAQANYKVEHVSRFEKPEKGS